MDHNFDDDPDAWIFESQTNDTPQGKHTFDGTTCPLCNVVHYSDEQIDIPPEVQQEISDVINNLPPGVRSQVRVIAADAKDDEINTTFNWINTVIKNVGMDMAILSTVLQLLDEMTGGEVSRRIELTKCEMEVFAGKVCWTSINKALQDSRAKIDQEDDSKVPRDKKKLEAYIESLEALVYKIETDIKASTEKYWGLFADLQVPEPAHVVANDSNEIYFESEQLSPAQQAMYGTIISEVTKLLILFTRAR